jgi:hypothetical protein
LLDVALFCGVVCSLSGPVAFTCSTIRAAHSGSIPTSGPSATALARTNNESASANQTLVQFLLNHQGNAKWLVAVASANESAPIQISSGQPVMAIGGFNGGDAALSVDEAQQLVKSGQLHYYLASSGMGGGPGGDGGGGPMGGNSTITSWLQAHGTLVNLGNSSIVLYELKVD